MDHIRWLEEVDLAFLLTHHSPAWLEPDRRREFDADVYPPGRFYSHICGHLHEPEATDHSVGGAEVRRTRIGASLFGLERSANNVGRRHGYSAGQITLTPVENYLKACGHGWHYQAKLETCASSRITSINLTRTRQSHGRHND